MSTDDVNSWGEWSKHVLKELERLTASNENMRQGLEDFKVDITKELAKKTEVEAIRNIVQEMQLKNVQEISNIKEEFNKKLSEAQALNVDKRANADLQSGVAIATLKTELASVASIRGLIAGAIPTVVTLILLLVGYFLKAF